MQHPERVMDPAAEQALPTLEELLEQSPDHIYVYAPDGRFLLASRSGAAALGFSPAFMSGRSWRELGMPPAVMEPFLKQIRQVVDSGHPLSGECLYPLSDGARNFEYRLFPLSRQGRVTAVVSIVRDVTAARGLERALRQSEDRFRALIGSIPDIVFTLDRDLRITALYGGWVSRHGHGPEHYLGRRLSEFLVGSDVTCHLGPMERALSGEKVLYEWNIATPRGQNSWYQTAVSPVRAADGGVAGLVGVSRDVTPLKTAERRLRSAVSQINRIRGEWRATLDALPEVVCLIDDRFRILRCNRASEDFGMGRDAALIGRPLHEAIHPACVDPGCYLPEVLCEAAERLPTTGELTTQRLDAALGRHVRVRVRRLRHGRGWVGPSHLVVTLEDVTERVAAEERYRRQEDLLRQAQKLESIGQLSAGIAHEINTPTQYVGDNLVFLRDAFRDLARVLELLPPILEDRSGTDCPRAANLHRAIEEADLPYLGQEIPRSIQQAMDGVGRVSTIVQAMKAFSHPGPAEPTPVDIRECIRNTVTVARNRWKYVATLELDLAADLPLVSCVPGELNQVILNLVVNAADAIAEVHRGVEGGLGRIDIRARRVEGGVAIEVSDTGCGIPEDARSRIFEPFFTTKEVGRGSGQGLSLCHSIVVTKHRGRLSFETGSNRGTTFTVFLPVAGPGEAT